MPNSRCAGEPPGDSAGALAPRLYSACERVEQRHRSLPPKAGIGDALPELERLARLEVLAAFNEVRLHHPPDDAPFARADLAGDVARDLHLALVLLGRVGVRAVDHQPLGQLRFLQLL